MPRRAEGALRRDVVPMPRDEWRVTIPEHHPGYITWERFLANRHRLEANRTNSEVIAGPAREGLCLLQGMLVCGCCGRKLTVRYTGNGGLYPTYECNQARREALSGKTCVSTRATPIDAAIGERLLAAVTPVTIELALKALTTLEERDQAIGSQWRRRIEPARVVLKARVFATTKPISPSGAMKRSIPPTG